MPCPKHPLFKSFGTGHKFLREQLINICNSQFPKIPKVIIATKTRSGMSKALGGRSGRAELLHLFQYLFQYFFHILFIAVDPVSLLFGDFFDQAMFFQNGYHFCGRIISNIKLLLNIADDEHRIFFHI